MANKKTVALTQEQLKTIIETMRSGSACFRPNDRIATCLVLEANLGLRIEDILSLRPGDFVRDGSRYRLELTEKKTKKERPFTVPLSVYQFIKMYCEENHIGKDDLIFPIKERAVQKYLKNVADYLGYEKIGTHSFRKFFATQIYNNNNHDIRLVQQLLQHSSVLNTQRYIGIQSERAEAALENHVFIY